VNETKNESGQQDGTEKSAAKESPNQRFTIPPAVIKIIWAVLVEFAIILWICAEFFSEFFSGIASTKIAAWLLGLSLILCFSYIAHKLLAAKGVKNYKKPIYFLTVISCLLVVIICWRAQVAIDEKWKSENEPKVIPPVVQLSDGKYEKLTRVLICNPSDSWIYQLTLLIQVESNRYSIEKVQTTLADSPSGGDKFDDATKNHRTDALMGPWGMADYIQYDILQPPDEGRLLILYDVAPKQMRVLWIKGSVSTNSFAKISVLEWRKTPLVLDVDSKENTLVWPGPTSNSVYWSFFPNAAPMDLSFGEKPTPAAPTNMQNSIQMPSKPFRGIPLQ